MDKVVERAKRRIKPHHKPTVEYKGKLYMHGTGCKDCPDCFECPKPDCDWVYPRPH